MRTSPFLFTLFLLAYTAPAMNTNQSNFEKTFQKYKIPKVSGDTAGTQKESGISVYIYTPELTLTNLFDFNGGNFTWQYAFTTVHNRQLINIPFTTVDLPSSFRVKDFLDIYYKDKEDKSGYYYFRYGRMENETHRGVSQIVRVFVPPGAVTSIKPSNPPPVNNPPPSLPQPPGEQPPGQEAPPPVPATDYTGFFHIETLENIGLNKFLYTFENFSPEDAEIRPAPDQIFNTFFFGPREIWIRFAKPGIKKVSVSGISKPKTYTLYALAPATTIPILLNANDSNTNNIADYLDQPFPENPPSIDHELVHFNALAPERMISETLGSLHDDTFFKTFQGFKLKLTCSGGLRLWSSASRRELADTEHLIHEDNRGAIREWLASIYLEGIAPGATDKDNEILLKIGIDDNQMQIVARWPVTVLHLYINHDKTGIENSGILKDNNINQIVNPAVIPILPLQPVEETRKTCAIFQLDSSNPKLLEEYAHLIEWSASADSIENTPLFLNPKIKADGSIIATGPEVFVSGTSPTSATLGVRLAGSNHDYLSFRKQVVPLRNVPLTFHFFGNVQHPHFNAETAQWHYIISRFPSLFKTANIIGQQAGIAFKYLPLKPVENVNTSNLLQREILGTSFFNALPATFHLKPTAAGASLPPLLPNKLLFFAQDNNGNALWSGALLPGESSENIVKIDLQFPPFFLPGHGKPTLLLPHLPHTLVESGMQLLQGTYFHLRIPDWVTLGGGWPYSTAIAHKPGTININFLQNTHPENMHISGIVPPNDTLQHLLPTEEKEIILTTWPKANLIPRLHNQNIAATVFSTNHVHASLQNSETHFARNFVQLIIQAMGLQEHGLNGDLQHYAPTPPDALLQNRTFLLTGDEKLLINPISPPTDPFHYQAHPVKNSENILFPDPHSDAASVKINSGQAALLNMHPFLEP